MNKRKVLHIRVDESLTRALAERARGANTTSSELARGYIVNHLRPSDDVLSRMYAQFLDHLWRLPYFDEDAFEDAFVSFAYGVVSIDGSKEEQCAAFEKIYKDVAKSRNLRDKKRKEAERNANDI